MTSLAASERIAQSDARPSPAERLLGMIEHSHGRICAVLILLSLACFLPGFISLQPMDRDEPRYAQASKQMLESGDFVDIRFQDEARHKKPVGIYWMQSAAVAAGDALGVPEAHTTIALYRPPSLFGAIATVLLTYWAALAFMRAAGRFLAAALHGRLRDPDGRGAARQDRRRADRLLGGRHGRARPRLFRPRRGTASASSPVLIFWLGLALGVLVKGPLVLMFAGLCRARAVVPGALGALAPGALGRGLGVLVLAGPRAALVRRHRSEDAAANSLPTSVGHDMLGKVGTAQELSLGPAGLLPARLLRDLLARRHPGRPLRCLSHGSIAATIAIAFALAWIVPSWIVFEARADEAAALCACRSIRRSRSSPCWRIARLRRAADLAGASSPRS